MSYNIFEEDMQKKVVIFDLDGTLLNTLNDLTDSTNYVLKKYNYPQKTLNEVRNLVGNGVSKLIERAIPDGKENSYFVNCLKDFKDHYSKNMYDNTCPYDGIISALQELRQKGLKIAVASNKFDTAVKELCRKYFTNLIDFSIGEDEKNGIYKKPDPAMVSSIIKKYSVCKEEVLYVGDSEVDIQTAQNSGVDCLSVSWGFKSREFLENHGAKIIIDSPVQISEYIN